MLKPVFSFFIVILMLSLPQQVISQYTWRTKACLPSAVRDGKASFGIGNKGYIVGGSSSADPAQNEVWEYDEPTDTWTQKNNYPLQAACPSSFVIRDTAYVGLGFDGSGTYYTNFYRYDIPTDSWIPVAPFPGVPRYLAMQFVLNGKAYVGCGKGAGQNNDFYEYDPIANQWTSKSSFPGLPRQNGFGAAVGNLGYMGLGWDGSTLNDSYSYNPVTDIWTPIAAFAGPPRAVPSVFVINDTFYLAGGRLPNLFYDDCWRYDVAGNQWIQEESFSCWFPPLGSLGGFTINGHGFMMGGMTDDVTWTRQLLQFGPADGRFAIDTSFLGNDTSYCGSFSHVLYSGNPCTRWSTGVVGDQITVTAPGTYWAYLPSSCGVKVDTINITSGQPVNLGSDTTLCTGQTMTIDVAIPNGTYVWQDNSTASTFTVSSAGTYSVTVTAQTGCSGTDAVVVTYSNQIPVLNLGADNNFCGAFSLTLTAPQNATWSTGVTAQQITITSPGTYSAQITTGCGTSFDTINITQTIPPAVQLPNSASICQGDSTILQPVTAATNLLWNTGATSSSITVNQPGVYWVEGWDDPSCRLRDSIIVSSDALSSFSLGKDTSVCGTSFLLKATGGTNYLWQDNSTDSTYNVVLSGTYRVTISNSCGTTSDEIYVEAHPDECRLLIPTAFSPNRDGVNDILRAVCRCPTQKYQLHIYNRWGELVYQTTDILDGWDGMYKGIEQPVGVYTYYGRSFNNCEQAIKEVKGNFTLIR